MLDTDALDALLENPGQRPVDLVQQLRREGKCVFVCSFVRGNIRDKTHASVHYIPNVDLRLKGRWKEKIQNALKESLSVSGKVHTQRGTILLAWGRLSFGMSGNSYGRRWKLRGLGIAFARRFRLRQCSEGDLVF